MLAIALQRAKGRDGGGKQFVGQRQKLLFEMESELAEERPKTSGEPLNRFPPVRVHRNGALSHIAMPLA